MPQDAFTIGLITGELSELLTGGKISKVSQVDRDTLTLIIYTQKGNVKLDICLSARDCRISLSENDEKPLLSPPSFCMLLRKHLQNAEILKVEQVEFERIVIFTLGCESEFEYNKLQLICELMGKYSNAVLVKDGIILGALKSTAIGENTRRVLFSGAKYALPEKQDKTEPNDIEGIREILKYPSADLAKTISDKIKGVAYSTALDLVETFNGSPSAEDISFYLTDKKISPAVIYENGEPRDFKAKRFSGGKPYPTLLEAQKAYYDRVIKKERFEGKKRKLFSALNSGVKKAEKRLQNIEEKLLDCRDMEKLKLKGELITANIYLISRGQEKFEAVNYYDEEGGKIVISLDKLLTPAQNAQRYFKKYAKLKRTAATVERQKAENIEELNYFKSVEAQLNCAEDLSDLNEIAEELKEAGLLKDEEKRKKKPALTPFREFEKDGFKILAGRSNLQNDRLLKSVSGGDMWLHTQKYHSSHVVILTGGKEAPDGVLRFAAEICAYFSDGRNGSKIPVDYTPRKYVKKPPKAAAGFVIYSEYKTLLVEPDGHAEAMIR